MKPEFVVVYSGLGGISARNMLEDLLNGLKRKPKETYDGALLALRRRGAASVAAYYRDYVSYGIGGGDATVEHYLGAFMLFLVRATADDPERLVLIRPEHSNVVVLADWTESVSPPPPPLSVRPSPTE